MAEFGADGRAEVAPLEALEIRAMMSWLWRGTAGKVESAFLKNTKGEMTIAADAESRRETGRDGR